MRVTSCWSREECEEEGAAEATDCNPHSPSPCAPRGGGGRKMGVKLSPGKKGGVGRRCFKI